MIFRRFIVALCIVMSFLSIYGQGWKEKINSENPKTVRFIVYDGEEFYPLIGASVYMNKKSVRYFFSIRHNLEKDSCTFDKAWITDLDGWSGKFTSLKDYDSFTFEYAGYEIKSVYGKDLSDVNEIALIPYGTKVYKVQIRVVGMGVGYGNKKKIKVVNENSGEIIEICQKDGSLPINVRIGDSLRFTSRGRRTIVAKFDYHIPERLNISPIKGAPDDIQYLKF